MKKFLVLALVVVLTLSLTVVASAATFDPSVGGRITWVYADSDVREDNPVHYEKSGIKLLLKGKVSDEATGTWGALGAKIDGWADGSNGESSSSLNTNSIYEFGINNIGGSNFNLWYSNFENEKGNRGQGKIYDIDPIQTHDDCMFDRDLSNVIGLDYVTDNVVVNFGYVPDKNVDFDKNVMSIAATFNFDGGNVHVGYWDDKVNLKTGTKINSTTNEEEDVKDDFEANEIIVGAEMKLGFGTIKVDYLTLDVGKNKADAKYNYNGYDWEGGSIIQAGAFFDAIKLGVTVAIDDKYFFPKDGGYAYEIKYLPIDNVTLCYRAGDAKDEADEGKNFTNFYVGYKYGVIESRVGIATYGEDNDAKDTVYASCYVSFW